MGTNTLCYNRFKNSRSSLVKRALRPHPLQDVELGARIQQDRRRICKWNNWAQWAEDPNEQAGRVARRHGDLYGADLRLIG